jgi:hypothetical protein
VLEHPPGPNPSQEEKSVAQAVSASITILHNRSTADIISYNFGIMSMPRHSILTIARVHELPPHGSALI